MSSPSATSSIIDLVNADWQPLTGGVQFKAVWADEPSNRRALLIRFDAGAALARHRHDGDEVLYVLEGTVADDHTTVEAGNVGYRPPGCTHTVRSPGGALSFAVISGGTSPTPDGQAGGPPSELFAVTARPETEVRPGVFQREMWADAATDRRAVLVRYAPGAEIPVHRHDGEELIFVLDGTVEDDSGAVTAGNAGFRPDGCVHTVASPGGAQVFAVLRGGIEPL